MLKAVKKRRTKIIIYNTHAMRITHIHIYIYTTLRLENRIILQDLIIQYIFILFNSDLDYNMFAWTIR